MILFQEGTHKNRDTLFCTDITEDSQKEKPYVFLTEQFFIGRGGTTAFIIFQFNARKMNE